MRVLIYNRLGDRPPSNRWQLSLPVPGGNHYGSKSVGICDRAFDAPLYSNGEILVAKAGSQTGVGF